MPSSRTQRFVISLSFFHRRKSFISRAYPSVVPITDEISPDEGFQFLRCHSFCVVPSIEELLLHTCPHAFAPCIVMAASAGAVHALENAMLCSRPSVSLTGVLCSPVRVVDAGYEWTALSSVRSHKDAFMFVSIASPRTAASKQSNMADTYNFPSFALISVMSVTHYFNGSADVKSRFSRSSGLRASRSAFVIPFGLRFGRWLSPIFLHDAVNRSLAGNMDVFGPFQ